MIIKEAFIQHQVKDFIPNAGGLEDKIIFRKIQFDIWNWKLKVMVSRALFKLTKNLYRNSIFKYFQCINKSIVDVNMVKQFSLCVFKLKIFTSS